MRYFKYAIIAIFAGIVTHLAMILVGPTNFERSTYDQMEQAIEMNKFHTISETFGQNILGFKNPDFQYGICAYDLADEALIVDTDFGDGFGILSVYGVDETAIYSINSDQTKQSKIKLALLPEGLENNLPSGVVFHRIPSRKGFVVVRLAVKDIAHQAMLEDQMKKSKCENIAFEADE